MMVNLCSVIASWMLVQQWHSSGQTTQRDLPLKTGLLQVHY
jgi:hypothetical protein